MRLSSVGNLPRLWRDADRRRALLLSLTLHLAFLLLFALLYRAPEVAEQPGYFVIDVGPPGADSGPAEAALEPLVVEAPEAATAEAIAPEAIAPAGITQAAVAEPELTPTPPVPPAEVAAAPAELPAPEPVLPPEPVPAQASLPAPDVPAPEVQALEVQAPAPVAEPLPPLERAEVAPPEPLPVVEEPELAEPERAELEAPDPVVAIAPSPPQPLAVEEAAEPVASVAVLLEPSRLEVALPQAEVELAAPLEQEVRPEAAVEVVPARPVDLPLPQLELGPRDVLPEVEVELVQPQEPEPVLVALPRPQLEVSLAGPLPVEEVLEPEVLEPEVLEPEVAEAAVPAAVAVEPETPEETASEVTAELEPEVAPEPTEEIVLGRTGTSEVEEVVEVEPLEAELVDAPELPSEAELSFSLPEPQVEVAPPEPAAPPGPAAELAPEPEPASGGFIVESLPDEELAEEAAPEPLEPPLEAAAVRAPPAAGNPMSDSPMSDSPMAEPTPAPPPPQDIPVEPQAAEDAPFPEAEREGLPGTVTLDPYEDQRHRPIVAILDNANPSAGRQSGLREASVVYEMPVEGNLTRLMAVYDRADPGRVGPIRSARDYQHRVVEDLGGALVHIGGSPAALDAIARGRAPSFNALEQRFEELYSRAPDAPAPYDLYSDGARLRSFLRGANLETARSLRGTIYRPAPELPDSSALLVSYPGDYSSGFTYLPELNLYRWQRSGVPALDAGGESVVVQAVVVARVEGSPLPGDREGRLYLAVDRGGEATLYLAGKVIRGRWQQQNGFGFIAEDGQPVDLTPFKTWISLVPSWAQVAGR